MESVKRGKNICYLGKNSRIAVKIVDGREIEGLKVVEIVGAK